MPKEIERKFVVSDLRAIDGRIGHRIVQGYIADEPMTVRVRIIEAESFMTLKGKAQGISRDEYEFPIPIRHARELIAQYCGTRVIEKVRYRVPHGEFVIEVDVFGGRHAGLVIAEVELDDVDQRFDPPEWLGQEVTDDRRFSNSNLSLADALPLSAPDAAQG